jgi:hypothetical protein
MICFVTGCMKNIKTFKKYSFLILSVLISFVACKKNDSSESTAQTPMYQLTGPVGNQVCVDQRGLPVAHHLCTGTNTGYVFQNGVCYGPNSQIYPNSYCQNGVGNTGYYFSNGNCYNNLNQIVPANYCSNTTGVLGQQCIGTYLYQSGYWTQMVYCSGYNCRGYTLTEVSTNRLVTCQ